MYLESSTRFKKDFEWRLEHLFTVGIVPVIDASLSSVRERPLKEFFVTRFSDVLAEPAGLILVFGKPNLSLYYPDRDGKWVRFYVKSLHRKETTLELNQTLAQSGVWVHIPDVSNETLEAVRARAEAVAAEGLRYKTCVNGTAQLLDAVGFSLPEKELAESVHPYPFFESLVTGGLRLNGVQVTLSFIRTTSDSLERHFLDVSLSEASTPFRHLRRNLPEGAQRLWRKTVSTIVKPFTGERLRRTPCAPLQCDEPVKDLELRISQPTWWAVGIRLLGGSHSVYEIDFSGQSRVRVSDFLQTALPPFPDEKKSLYTKLKKKLFFGRGAIAFYRNILIRNYVSWSGLDERHFHQLLLTDTPEHREIYNYVLTDKKFILARTKVGFLWLLDWALAKHLLIGGWDSAKLCAGEIMQQADGTYVINNNSGTLQPDQATLEACAAFAGALLPNLEIVPVPVKVR